ncbi:hypothetical protein [Burkholderia gladioli]|uniref:hypothetical protein n=1 Tax=Burkholderia gladioli TaxID=28095 RepID=UPI00163EAFFF|nr:hypothetical protein [Burkholderia gladioli]URV28339.1 hypothetical protein NAL90_19195 [Burkholderia gladioli]
MQAFSVKRNVMRTLLVFHLLGIALVIGSRAANIVVYRQTSQAGVPMLGLGRDLGRVIGQSLTSPSLFVIVVTGVAMAFLRYGRRPPLWVWIKACLTVLVLTVAFTLVGPSLRVAQELARWSTEHNQLAVHYEASAMRASLYGGIVFALFFVNIVVAVWKPFLGSQLPGFRRSNPGRGRRQG